MGTKLLFTAVTQPNPQNLGDLLFLLLRQRIIELQRPLALVKAGGIVMCISITPRHTNSTANFFYQCCSRKWSILLIHCYKELIAYFCDNNLHCLMHEMRGVQFRLSAAIQNQQLHQLN